MGNLRSTYNKIAEAWHEDHQHDDWWVEGTGAFSSFLSPGGTVLDVGCGGGTKSRYLIGKGLRVTGIDFAKKLIEIAREEVPEGEFVVMDAKDLDGMDRQFDGVFAQAFLLHTPKKEVAKMIDLLARKLRARGCLYIAVKERRKDKPEEEIRRENDYGYPYERFFSYFTLEELRRYMGNVGLESVYESISPSGKTNWIQIIGSKKLGL